MPGHRVANLFCMPGRCPAILMTATRWAPSSKPLILGGGDGALFRDAGCLAVPGARKIIEARPPAMPTCLIEDENGVGAGGDLGGDLVEMKLHSLGVAGGQHQGGAGSAFRAYRAEQIG